jgi:hypothetical protein
MKNNRQYIQRPNLKKAVQAVEIQNEIWRLIEEYKRVATSIEATWFFNNIRTNLKQSGFWLDGLADKNKENSNGTHHSKPASNGD